MTQQSHSTSESTKFVRFLQFLENRLSLPKSRIKETLFPQLVLERLGSELQTFQCLTCRSLNVFALYHCQRCLNEIEKLYYKPEWTRLDSKISVLSLFDWVSDEERRLASIVKLLKHPLAKANWRYAAGLIGQKRWISSFDIAEFLSSGLYVPIPGHSPTSVHSHQFAEQLAHAHSGCYLPLIAKIERYLDSSVLANSLSNQTQGKSDNGTRSEEKSPKAQKTLIRQKDLSRTSRQASRICISVDFTTLQRVPKGAVITLTDDIMTTGNTISKVASQIFELRPDLGIQGIVFAQRRREVDRAQSENSAVQPGRTIPFDDPVRAKYFKVNSSS